MARVMVWFQGEHQEAKRAQLDALLPSFTAALERIGYKVTCETEWESMEAATGREQWELRLAEMAAEGLKPCLHTTVVQRVPEPSPVPKPKAKKEESDPKVDAAGNP